MIASVEADWIVCLQYSIQHRVQGLGKRKDEFLPQRSG